MVFEQAKQQFGNETQVTALKLKLDKGKDFHLEEIKKNFSQAQQEFEAYKSHLTYPLVENDKSAFLKSLSLLTGELNAEILLTEETLKSYKLKFAKETQKLHERFAEAVKYKEEKEYLELKKEIEPLYRTGQFEEAVTRFNQFKTSLSPFNSLYRKPQLEAMVTDFNQLVTSTGPFLSTKNTSTYKDNNSKLELKIMEEIVYFKEQNKLYNELLKKGTVFVGMKGPNYITGKDVNGNVILGENVYWNGERVTTQKSTIMNWAELIKDVQTNKYQVQRVTVINDKGIDSTGNKDINIKQDKKTIEDKQEIASVKMLIGINNLFNEERIDKDPSIPPERKKVVKDALTVCLFSFRDYFKKEKDIVEPTEAFTKLSFAVKTNIFTQLFSKTQGIIDRSDIEDEIKKETCEGRKYYKMGKLALSENRFIDAYAYFKKCSTAIFRVETIQESEEALKISMEVENKLMKTAALGVLDVGEKYLVVSQEEIEPSLLTKYYNGIKKVRELIKSGSARSLEEAVNKYKSEFTYSGKDYYERSTIQPKALKIVTVNSALLHLFHIAFIGDDNSRDKALLSLAKTERSNKNYSSAGFLLREGLRKEMADRRRELQKKPEYWQKMDNIKKDISYFDKLRIVAKTAPKMTEKMIGKAEYKKLSEEEKDNAIRNVTQMLIDQQIQAKEEEFVFKNYIEKNRGKNPAAQEFISMENPFNDWKPWKWSDKTWDTIKEETLINAAMLAVSGGVGNALRSGVTLGGKALLKRYIAKHGIRRALSHGVTYGAGFAAEIWAFETTHRVLRTGRGEKDLFERENYAKGLLHAFALLGVMKIGSHYLAPGFKAITPYKDPAKAAELTAFQKILQTAVPRAASMAAFEAPTMTGFTWVVNKWFTEKPENLSLMAIYLRTLIDLPAIAAGGHLFNKVTGLQKVITKWDLKSKLYGMQNSKNKLERENGKQLQDMLNKGKVPVETVMYLSDLKLDSTKIKELEDFMQNPKNQEYLAVIRAAESQNLTQEKEILYQALAAKLKAKGFSEDLIKDFLQRQIKTVPKEEIQDERSDVREVAKQGVQKPVALDLAAGVGAPKKVKTSQESFKKFSNKLPEEQSRIIIEVIDKIAESPHKATNLIKQLLLIKNNVSAQRFIELINNSQIKDKIQTYVRDVDTKPLDVKNLQEAIGHIINIKNLYFDYKISIFSNPNLRDRNFTIPAEILMLKQIFPEFHVEHNIKLSLIETSVALDRAIFRCNNWKQVLKDIASFTDMPAAELKNLIKEVIIQKLTPREIRDYEFNQLKDLFGRIKKGTEDLGIDQKEIIQNIEKIMANPDKVEWKTIIAAREVFGIKTKPTILSENPFTKENIPPEKAEQMAEVLKAFEDIPVKYRQKWGAKELLAETLRKLPKNLQLSQNQQWLIESMIFKYKEQQAQLLFFSKLSPADQLFFVNGILHNNTNGQITDLKAGEFKISFRERKSGPQILIYLTPEANARFQHRIPRSQWQTMSKSEKTEYINKTSDGIQLDQPYDGGIMVLNGFKKRSGLQIHEHTHASAKFLGIRPKYKSLDNLANQHLQNGDYQSYLKLLFQKKLQYFSDEIVAYSNDGRISQDGIVKFMDFFKGSYFNDNIPDISSLKSNLKIRPAELARIQVMHNQYVRDLWISTVEAVNTASKVAKYPNGINILRLTNVVEWKNLLKHLAQKHPDVAATGERNVPGVVEGRTGPKPGEIQGGSGTRMENLKIVNADIKKLIAGIKSKNLQINDIDQLVNYSNKSFGSPENRKALLESFKDIVQFAEKYGYNFAENFKLPNDFTSAYKTILTIRDSIYRNLELLNGINYKNPDQRTIIMKAYSTFFEFKEFAAKPTKEQYAEMLSKFQKALQNYLAPKEAGELLGRLMLEKRFSTQSHETPVDFTNIEIPTKAQPTMEQIANMAVVLRNFEKIPVKLRQQYSAEKLYETVLKTVQDRNLSGSQKKLIFEKIKEYKEQQKIALDVVNSPREKQLQFIKDTIKKEIGAADVVLPDDFSFKIKYIENADGVPQMHITVPPEVFIQMSKQIKNWQTLTKLQKTKLIEKTTTIGENIDAYNKLISFYRSDRSVKAGPRIHETAHASLGLLGMRRQYNKITENISPESKGYPEFISRTITGDYHLAGDEIVAYLKAGISHSADPVKFAQEIKSHLSLKYLRKWSDNIHETYVRSNSGNLPREVQLQRLELNKKYFEKLQQSVDTAVDMAVKIAAFQNGYNMLKLTPVNRWGELLTHLNNEKLSTTGRLEQPFHSNLPEANSFKYNNITFSETNLPKTYKGLMEVDIKHPGLLDKLGINTPEALKVFETYKEYVRSLERKIQDSIDKSKPDYATLSEIMRNVGAKSNATGSKIADLKSIVRSTEKVIEDKGKIEKLLDIVRGTLVFDRHADVYTALQSLTSNPLVDRIFMKDKFGIRDANGNFNLENPAPVENGFRNLHLNIRLKNGHVVELQLQIKEMALVNGELPVPVEKLKAANPFDANEKEAAKNIAQRIEKPNIVLPDITQPGVKPNSHELFEIFRSCNENVIIEKELKAKILKVLTILHNHAWDTYKERSSK